jgi:uncharacterized UBP type Zn finger protein
MSECNHKNSILIKTTTKTECVACVVVGDTWVNLRLCTECGHVGCCEASKNKHALMHYRASGHPVVRSITGGQDWFYCYADQVYVEPE